MWRNKLFLKSLQALKVIELEQQTKSRVGRSDPFKAVYRSVDMRQQADDTKRDDYIKT